MTFELENIIGNSIRILDRTQETDWYIPENLEPNKHVSTRYFKYTYSDTCTINVIYYHSTTENSLINVYYTNHCSKLDEVELNLPKDGYYEIVHIILPTIDWLENKLNDPNYNLSKYSLIYVTDGESIYKYINEELIKCDISEIVLVNSENTTITRCFKDFFCIWFLQKCYVNLSKNILGASINKCKNSQLEDSIFKRDFVWMTLNVIKYYIEFNQLSEAQNILEEVNGCNGFCKDSDKITTNKSSCGCNG